MSIRDKIEELKRLAMVPNQDFAVPGEYFLTHIAENSAAWESSKPLRKRQDFYKQLLIPVIRDRYGITIQVELLNLMQIKKCRFVHGVVTLSNGVFLIVYFFEDIQSGMAIVHLSNRTDFFRLTVLTGHSSQPLILPPPTASTIH